MEKLADNLQKLGEDDLLHVVEMVHNNKTPDTYTKNDVERKMLVSHLNIMPPRREKYWFGEPYRRWISRGSVHSTRQLDTNALGFLARKARHLRNWNRVYHSLVIALLPARFSIEDSPSLYAFSPCISSKNKGAVPLTNNSYLNNIDCHDTNPSLMPWVFLFLFWHIGR